MGLAAVVSCPMMYQHGTLAQRIHYHDTPLQEVGDLAVAW